MHASRPVVALIPARGGSKGVPRKNLALVGGEPMLAHTVKAARGARSIDRTVVSSDDPEVLALAQALGATALPRPAEFASDTASAVDVVQHFIDEMAADMHAADPLIVYLQPTSPLRRAAHIDAAFALLGQHAASTLVSVTALQKSPYKAFGLDAEGRLASLFDETLSNARRQDLPPTFLPNGAIYVFAVSDFTARGGFPSNGAVPYVMSDADSIDIDTPDDLAHVNRLLGDAHG